MKHYYIELPVEQGKAQYLVSEYDAKFITRPKKFKDITLGEGLICVLNNGRFDVVIYCYSDRQFKLFSKSSNLCKKYWMVMKADLAKKLSGYAK